MGFKKHIRDLENQKTIVYCFGRFNPPTRGHQKLWEYVNKTARKLRADSTIYTSFSQNAKKNPLDFKDKVHAIELGTPKGTKVSKDNLKNTFQIAEDLVKKGYQKIVFVIGADRIGDFDSLKKYVNEWSDGETVIDIVSFSGKSRIGNYSGTRMRELAKSDNFEEFFADLPAGIKEKDAQKIFEQTKKGLGL